MRRDYLKAFAVIPERGNLPVCVLVDMRKRIVSTMVAQTIYNVNRELFSFSCTSRIFVSPSNSCDAIDRRDIIVGSNVAYKIVDGITRHFQIRLRIPYNLRKAFEILKSSWPLLKYVIVFSPNKICVFNREIPRIPITRFFVSDNTLVVLKRRFDV